MERRRRVQKRTGNAVDRKEENEEAERAAQPSLIKLGHVDRGNDPSCKEVRAGCEAKLRTVVDPDEVNRRAFADQEKLIETLGGCEAVLADGDRYAEYSYTPVPVA